MAKRTNKEILTDFQKIFPEEEPSDYALRQKILERNILYVMGNQWFNHQFKPLYNSNVPTPVSNIIRDYVRSMLSLYLGSRYRTRVYPNSQESQDEDAAFLGQFFLQWIAERDNCELEDEKELIALWTIIAGVGFGMVDVSMDTGRFVNGTINKGDITIESLLPGSVRVPSLGNKLHKKEWVGLMRLKPREWVEDTYEQIIPKAENLRLMDHEKKLMQFVSDINQWAGSDFSAIDSFEDKQDEDLVVFQEIEWRPTKKYPKGRYEAVCEGVVCAKEEKLQLPIGEEGEWLYRVQDFHYNHNPGCFWSASGIDDLISPQNFINEADQAAMMNFKELGRPTLFTPFGVTLKRISEFGRSFLAVEWDDPLGSDRKPEIARGTPYPEQLLEMRGLQREMAQDAAGNPKNVLAGKSAHSGASGYLMDTLREVAERSHKPDIDRFYRSWGGINRRCLVLAPKVFKETRMLRIKGEGDKPLVKAFLGASLHGNTDVRMEEETGMSSTRAGQNAAISEMAKSGFFRDEVVQPNLRNHVLKTMGLPRPPDETNMHRERAERENRAIREGVDPTKIPIALPKIPVQDPKTEEIEVDPETGDPVMISVSDDPLFELDNDVIHMEVHDSIILSPEYADSKVWTKERKVILFEHRMLHKAKMDAMLEEQKQEMIEMQEQAQEPSKGIEPVPEGQEIQPFTGEI